MKAALWLILLLANPVFAGALDRYSNLVRADPPDQKGVASSSMRVTYLGVNGYQLETGDGALLIDPYFTRASLGTVALQRPLEPDVALVRAGRRKLRARMDAILVTHGHFDHLLDVPLLIEATGGRLLSGPTAVNLAVAAGAPRNRTEVVTPGQIVRKGPWKIHVLAAAHDRLLGRVPYQGTVGESGAQPKRAGDWVLGEPLAFLVEANGRRVYIDSGGRPEHPVAVSNGVDLAILGCALPDSRTRFAQAIRRLRPRFVLPSHQDNFFAPFESGFRFAAMSDFPELRAIHRREKLSGEIVLLDYFRPWTIP